MPTGDEEMKQTCFVQDPLAILQNQQLSALLLFIRPVPFALPVFQTATSLSVGPHKHESFGCRSQSWQDCPGVLISVSYLIINFVPLNGCEVSKLFHRITERCLSGVPKLI